MRKKVLPQIQYCICMSLVCMRGTQHIYIVLLLAKNKCYFNTYQMCYEKSQYFVYEKGEGEFSFSSAKEKSGPQPPNPNVVKSFQWDIMQMYSGLMSGQTGY